MSRSYRSYDEDWQRRKSILIRSLFHDIPILSPVQEESNDSSDYIPRRDIFDVPSRTYDVPDRPYSPLPPLIIEREPNRHDEPEEYYRKLLDKIKKIYQKLFIDNRDIDNEDLNVAHDSLINDDDLVENDGLGDIDLDLNVTENVHQDDGSFDSANGGVRKSFNSIDSNGYGADYESIDTEMIDVENYTESNEDEVMMYEEEESNNEKIDDQEMSETEDFSSLIIDTETNKSKRSNKVPTEYLDEDEGSDSEELNEDVEFYNVRINDQEFIEREKSDNVRICDKEPNKTEEFSILIIDNEVSNKASISDREMNKTEESDNVNDKESSEGGESNNETSENQEFNDGNELNNIVIDNKDTNDIEESNNVTNKDLNSILIESYLKSKASERTPSTLSNVQAMEEDLETNPSSEGNEFRQVTTEALIHVDGSEDGVEKESRVYEDSVRSLILPTRRFRGLIEARNVDVEDGIEELSVLEDDEDPETTTTFGTVDNENVNENIEVMRTPQPKISQDSIPITRRSDSDTIIEHTALPQKLTTVTSSPQDGGDNNISEFKISDDLNEILTSIFNKSRNKEQTSPSRRKRKLNEDISVQTSERVTWDELRGNFFVGAPKIFRLCACVDHICY